jgi:asparagine synthetase A
MREDRRQSSQVRERGAELSSLALRLDDGEARIQAALSRGEDVSAWEDFWLRLLHEYESLHDGGGIEGSDEQASIAA